MTTSRFVPAADDETADSQDDRPTEGLPAFTADDFEEWYRQIWPKLVAYATVQAGGRADVGREAAAVAAAKAYERWHSGRVRDPNVWVYTVARNELRRGWRRRRLEQRALARVAERGVTDPPVISDAPLLAAVAALSERQRQAITLRYQCDLTQAQVAQVMGVAPGTVAATLDRARKNLRAALETQTPGESER
jgi:RNA polymerase sigma-70 factor (ECF subfamily)